MLDKVDEVQQRKLADHEFLERVRDRLGQGWCTGHFEDQGKVCLLGAGRVVEHGRQFPWLGVGEVDSDLRLARLLKTSTRAVHMLNDSAEDVSQVTALVTQAMDRIWEA